ncbi:MAG TPA: RNase H family protein, partial [Chitinophagaceae bacterium]
MSDSHPLIIYTDGASRGNPGRGGYGAILMWGNKAKELSGGYR